MKPEEKQRFGPFERAFRMIGLNRIHIHLMLIVVSGITLVPYLWALSTSLKYRTDVFTSIPRWIPSPINLGNYGEVFHTAPFGVFLVNTILVVVGILLVQPLTVTTAAYVFARLNSKERTFFSFFSWFR